MSEKKLKTILISHSSMETMEQCLLKWYYKYIEKLKVDVPVGPEADFGSYIHEIAEKFTGDSAKDLKVLSKKLLEDYTLAPEMKKKVPKAIKNFWNYWKDHPELHTLTQRNKERRVVVNSHEEGFNIIGIFDLIYKKEKDGRVTVLDWKTNKKPRDATKQLSFYFYILKLIGEVPDSQSTLDCKIVYLCVDAVDRYVEVPYKIDELDLESAAARLEGFINKIKAKKTDKSKYRMKPGPLCPWCDYYKAGICKGKDALDSDSP